MDFTGSGGIYLIERWCHMELFRNSELFGMVEMSIDGNYHTFEATGGYLPGIFRVYLYDSAGSVFPLGVLSPSGGALWLRRTFSRTEIARRTNADFTHGVVCEGDTPPDTPNNSVAADHWRNVAEPATLTRDEILSDALDGARGCMYRRLEEITELAVPGEGLRHITPAAVLARAEEIGGGEYFILALDSGGRIRRIENM